MVDVMHQEHSILLRNEFKGFDDILFLKLD